MLFYRKPKHLMRRTVCASEIVCEEEHEATLHREFLGGSEISYSTPHRREAHTHTIVGHNTKLSTHMVDKLNTKLSTHTHRVMKFKPKRK